MISNKMEVIDISFLIDSIDDLFTEISDVLWVYDLKKDIICISDKINKICSCDFRSSINNFEDFAKIVHSGDQKKLRSSFADLCQGRIHKLFMEFRIICPYDGIKYFVIKGRCIEAKDNEGNVRSLLAGSLIDIDEKKSNERKINRMAYYDATTGLLNRSMFIYKTSIAIGKRRMDSEQCAVINLDLDNFKRINEIYGHNLGDNVLRSVSSIILTHITKQEILARFHGDGFFILLPKVTSYDEVETKVKKLLKAINRTITIEGIEITLTCSAGIVIYPFDGETADELIKNADAAMHKAKEDGRNRAYFFERSINCAMKKKIEMEKHLRSALKNNELYLVYQPQIDARCVESIAGTEALARWESPVYGNIPPVEFIPIMEDTELIIPVGLWILETACRQSLYWFEKKKMKIPVSVNVSPIQLKYDNFEKDVIDIIDKIGLPPELLKLEITESTLMENFQNTYMVFDGLRSKGVKIALDDFGKGYSSLNYLKSLPLDTLKIDKSFVDGLLENTKEKAIIGSIIDMAHFLDLDVVAEGVEKKEQYECLRYFGCNFIQGYYFSKPLTAENLDKIWIEGKKHQPSSNCETML